MTVMNMNTICKDKESSRSYFHPKDPISALTHFIAFLLSIAATPLLLIHAAENRASFTTLIGLSVFMMSMILLYGASASYHSFCLSDKKDMILKKLDHMSIFILIAGSYTPICLTAIGGTTGKVFLTVVWSIAAVGCLFKFFWVTCPRWVSSVIYIGMGWIVITVMPQTIAGLTAGGFIWMLIGGIIYTAGGIIYALKLPLIPRNHKGFGNHELFHLFVMAGSLCHFIVMYQYIAMMG